MSGHADSSRRSIRLKHYDYSQAGNYFFTICTHHRQALFGEIRNGQMKCNRARQAVSWVWRELPSRFPMIGHDEFIVMPNHVHGILILRPQRQQPSAMPQHRAGRASPAPTKTATDAVRRGDPWVARADRRSAENSPQHRAPSVGDIIGAFKSLATVAVNRALNRAGAPVWQRNFFEHILRRSDDIAVVRAYIAENPLQWASDRENPLAQGPLEISEQADGWLR